MTASTDTDTDIIAAKLCFKQQEFHPRQFYRAFRSPLGPDSTERPEDMGSKGQR